MVPRRLLMAIALSAMPSEAMAHGGEWILYSLAWDVGLAGLAIGYLIIGSAPLGRRFEAVAVGFAAQVVAVIALLIIAALDPRGAVAVAVVALVWIAPLAGFAFVLLSKRTGQGKKDAI